MKLFKKFWEGETGGRQIFSVAFPMILSFSSYTFMQFMDRKFLLMYSSEAFQAVVPAGMLSFAFLALFFDTTAYVNTFVAQYFGAGRNKRISKVLWQGIYFAFCSWPFMILLSFFSKQIFDFIGHPEIIRPLEVKYFKILTIGSIFILLNIVLTSFFTGRGKTKVIMWIRFFAMMLNIPLNYCMIFGKFGFPELGIVGAGFATLISMASITIITSFLILSKHNRYIYGTLSEWKFNLILFCRLLKYGFPNGVQFIMSIFGISFFLIIVGRIGTCELAATNATWALSSLIFMPMVGMGAAISIIIGQEIGRGRIKHARAVVKNSSVIMFCYIVPIVIGLIFIPELFLKLLFQGAKETNDLSEIFNMTILFSRFSAAYLFFDAVTLLFSAVIKGAGDTKFVMRASLILSISLLIIPSYFFCVVWKLPAWLSWGFLVLYMFVTSIVIYLRFRTGKWERMKVIES